MFAQVIDPRPLPKRQPQRSTADRYAHGFAFGDDQSRAERQALVDRAIGAQRCRWAIAPGIALETHAGKFEAGTALELADLDITPDQPAWKVMDRLVRSGAVLELSEERLRALAAPIDARFVVGRGALSTRRGILVPGEAITSADVASEGVFHALLEAGSVVERCGGAR